MKVAGTGESITWNPTVACKESMSSNLKVAGTAESMALNLKVAGTGESMALNFKVAGTRESMHQI